MTQKVAIVIFGRSVIEQSKRFDCSGGQIREMKQQIMIVVFVIVDICQLYS
jgi:hypothetical protein